MIRNNLVWPPRNGETLTPHQIQQSEEQAEYLRGVLFADKDCRFTKKSAGNVVGDIGITTADFWRGVLETSGSINMPDDIGKRAHDLRQDPPRLRLIGSLEFMHKFRDFLEQELGREWDLTRIRFDPTGRLNGSEWHLTGKMVQQIVDLLYSGCIIARESFARTAEEIMTWESRR